MGAAKVGNALNPGEEVDADLAEIEGGLATVEEKLGKRGHDLETFIAARARERRLLSEAGVVTTRTPRPANPLPVDSTTEAIA